MTGIEAYNAYKKERSKAGWKTFLFIIGCLPPFLPFLIWHITTTSKEKEDEQMLNYFINKYGV